MTELTKNEAKLISLGMTIQMRERKLQLKWLSDFQLALFDKERAKAESNYFDFWFEINREKLENVFTIKLLEDWFTDDEIDFNTFPIQEKFYQFCYDKCFQNI